MAVLTKITSRSLADNAVTSAHVQGDVIAAGDLAPNSVTASELADDAVDTAAIATDAVTNVKVADGAIDHADKIATGVVTTAKIADSSSTTTGITPAKIAENAVTSAKIATGAVIADGIGAGAVVEAGLGANAVTGAKIAAEAIEVKPHIKPGTLYPAYLGNKADGTATAALTTGPAGSTIASSRYGTVQSDGRMYYYTQINGSKPIKDPRIGTHFGGQRHKLKSIQKLKQESSVHAKAVYSVDGREYCRFVAASVDDDHRHGYSSHGTGQIEIRANDYVEIVGYFTNSNFSTYNFSGNNFRYSIDGTEVATDYGSTSTTTPTRGRFVDAESSIKLGTTLQLGIHTLKLRYNGSGGAKVYAIDLIAHDKFTDATCDYNNDPTITMDSTVKLSVGLSVAGTGIPAGATVSSITSTTVFELSAATTGGAVTNGTLTFGGSDMSIPPQNVVSYGKKFAVSPQSLHYDPFAYKTDGITAWTSPISGSNNHNGTAWPVGTGGSHNIDAATSLGLGAWINTNYYRPYNGGRVVIWIDTSGNIKTSVNMMPPNARSLANAANLTGGAEKGDDSAGTTSAATPNDNYKPTFTDQAIDHTQSEVAESYVNHREFGNGAANSGGSSWPDYSMIYTTQVDPSWVMDDGLTALTGNQNHISTAIASVSQDLVIGVAGFWHFTFIGTGFSATRVVHHDTSTATENYDTWVDGVLVEDSVTGSTANHRDSTTRNIDSIVENLPYGTHIVKQARTAASAFNFGWSNQTILQPKMPPISEDAVVLADYMLMADFKPQTHDGQAFISKGVRLNDVSRDVLSNATGSESITLETLDTTTGHRMFNSGASSGTSVSYRLPSFGTNIVHKGYASGVRAVIKIDTTTQTSTKTAGTVTDQEAFQHITTSKTLGVYNWGHDAVAGSNGLVSSYQIATPIHTSHHYQPFETPFLKELIGGDRNMEQTNLVVTVDGKTWDEVTRDTSYIGNNVVFLTRTGGHLPGSDTNLIWDEARGYSSSGSDPNYWFNKDFAIGYDRLYCLRDGDYTIHAHLHGSGTTDILAYIKKNGLVASEAWTDTGGGEQLAMRSMNLSFSRGDYLEVRGRNITGTSAYRTHVSITRNS